MDTQFSNKQIHKIFGVCMAYILSRLRHTQKKKLENKWTAYGYKHLIMQHKGNWDIAIPVYCLYKQLYM